MIRLIYPIIIQDIEALQSSIKDKGIDVRGISTFADKDAPQTLVFVDDKTSEESKSEIDNQVLIAAKAPPPEPPPAPTKEEDVTDEIRSL